MYLLMGRYFDWTELWEIGLCGLIVFDSIAVLLEMWKHLGRSDMFVKSKWNKGRSVKFTARSMAQQIKKWSRLNVR
jgi:hypothetical protein